MLDSPHVRKIQPQALLSDRRSSRQLTSSEHRPTFLTEVLRVTIARSGTMHGLAGWFDLKLTEGHIPSNAPSNLESTWGQVFFPFRALFKPRKARS